MGTRVDFYVSRGEDAEWLGSYPFDGWPDGVFGDSSLWIESESGQPTRDLPEARWREWVAGFLAKGGDRSTLPADGWPWPWETSRLTDYAYAWDGGVVYGSSFGRPWFEVDPDEESWGEPGERDDSAEPAVFPDMTGRTSVTYGPRSGLLVLSLPIVDAAREEGTPVPPRPDASS